MSPPSLVNRVEQACAQIIEQDGTLTFAAVASRARTSKATLYRRAELRSIVEEHRSRNREAHTLTGLVIELDHLRQGLEAVADKVRRHEEILRSLQRQANKTKRHTPPRPPRRLSLGPDWPDNPGSALPTST